LTGWLQERCDVADSALQSERFFRHMADRYYELRDAEAGGEPVELDRVKLYEDIAALALFAADWFKATQGKDNERR
jgi:hypothetical protein